MSERIRDVLAKPVSVHKFGKVQELEVGLFLGDWSLGVMVTSVDFAVAVGPFHFWWRWK